MKVIKNKIVYEENINGVEGKTLAIIFPEKDEELKTIVNLAKHDLIPRGAGTSLTGGTIPRKSTIIDMSKRNKILEINQDKKIAYVEAGILIKELNEKLKKFGLEFPIIPLFEGVETIGGMIAKNSSGAREIKYGRIVNWIDSLEVINGKGELIKVSKSDLSDFTGMEGTTGIIVRATLRLTNKKNRTISILKSSSLREILNANKKLRLNQEVCSIDLINREISSLLGFENKFHLFVEYETNEGLFKKEQYEKFYKLKNKAYNKIANEGYYLIENSKIYVDTIEDFLIHLEKNKIPYISHFASGVFYSFFKPEETEKQKETSSLVRKMKGKVAYSFGIGLLKKEFMAKEDLELARRVKARHDPQLKFNRDKLIDYEFKEEAIIKDFEEVKPEEEIKPEEKKEELQVEIKQEIQQEVVDTIVVEQEKEEIKEQPQQQEVQQQTETASQVDIKLPPPESKPNPEQDTLKKPDEKELTPEERDKVKKIASGFFGSKKESEGED